jgi:hypothetical protein
MTRGALRPSMVVLCSNIDWNSTIGAPGVGSTA